MIHDQFLFGFKMISSKKIYDLNVLYFRPEFLNATKMKFKLKWKQISTNNEILILVCSVYYYGLKFTILKAICFYVYFYMNE